MKVYSRASEDVALHIERMKAEFHDADLAEATVEALFIYDPEDTEAQVLSHNGYPAAATIKITSLKDRALGIADAVIVLDRAYWTSCTAAQRDALVDHELEHLERAYDEETGEAKSDPIGRPLLKSKRHDYQMGWFKAVAERHGEASPEVRQARVLLTETKQLFFEFNTPPPRKSSTRPSAHH